MTTNEPKIACCTRPAAGVPRICPECNHENLLVCPECEMCSFCQDDIDHAADLWRLSRGLEL